eukprot:NODE_159_length_3414_cov_88.879064_g137_i0.p1 GENE.NODE_159_length_3414_cov_88.879064_g137_i0~~NODE_159_length_3414_cov_88.879064_g137_i0.p1  ORF type:complete len:1068 (-),score=227.12 NODE_159_length_3414_cov_88.879064_g137_i0:210-3356(-)
MLACAWAVWSWWVYDRSSNELFYTDFFRAKVDHDWEYQCGWKSVNDFAELMGMRRRLKWLHHRGVLIFLIVTVFLLAVSITNLSFEIRKMLSKQPRVWNRRGIEDALTDMGTRFPTQYNYNVLVAVVSGLRDDFTTRNTDLKNFLESTNFATNSKKFTIDASLPSNSVPNWITMLSGVSPENTGILNEISVMDKVDVPFENLFDVTRNYLLGNGVAGSPLLRDFIGRGVNVLQGEATIREWELTKDANEKYALPADVARSLATTLAIGSNTTTIPYRFFLTQFSNVDVQGELWGIKKKDKYQQSITDTTQLLKDLTQAVDQTNNTVLMIISDHGHMDDGGNGGVNGRVTNIPVYFYLKNSSFSRRRYTGLDGCPSDSNRRYSLSMLDVAPTLAAILGVPVPRLSEGNYIDELLWLLEDTEGQVSNPNSGSVLLAHLQDLFIQRRMATCRYVHDVLNGDSVSDCMKRFNGEGCLQNTNRKSAICECHKQIQETRKYHHDSRKDMLGILVCRNFLGNFGFLWGGFLILIIALDLYTFCDIRSMIGGDDLHLVEKLAAHDASSNQPHGPAMTMSKSTKGQLGGSANRKAFLFAFVLQLIYWAGTVATFFITFALKGYVPDAWDPTMIHRTKMLIAWILTTIIPGVFMSFVVNRLFKIPLYFANRDSGTYGEYCKVDESELTDLVMKKFRQDQVGSEEPQPNRKKKYGAGFCEAFWRFMFDQEPDITNLVYLTKWYLILFTLFTHLGFLMATGPFTHYIPWTYSTPFVTDYNWRYRFRLLSFMLMGLPLLWSCVHSLLVWARPSVWNNRWDGCYELRLAADMKRLNKARVALRSTKDVRKMAAHLERSLDRRNERFVRAWILMHTPVTETTQAPPASWEFENMPAMKTEYNRQPVGQKKAPTMTPSPVLQQQPQTFLPPFQQGMPAPPPPTPPQPVYYYYPPPVQPPLSGEQPPNNTPNYTYPNSPYMAPPPQEMMTPPPPMEQEMNYRDIPTMQPMEHIPERSQLDEKAAFYDAETDERSMLGAKGRYYDVDDYSGGYAAPQEAYYSAPRY